jgi:peptidoglycan/xylan/chitin deacetylase (PgdA/CDA1 family)
MICRADKLLWGAGATLLASASAFGPSLSALAIPAGVFLAVLIDGIARPASSTLCSTVTHGPSHTSHVALTFDDGPDPQVTPAVLDELARHDVRATFFAIGHHVEAHRALAERIVAEGHELANHSWRHSRWQSFWGARAQQNDMQRGERVLASITRRPANKLFRAPFGIKTPEIARAAMRSDLRMVAWSLHSRDTVIADPQRVAERVLRKVKAGDIILMHDGHDLPDHHRSSCARTVALILAGLAQRKLVSVTVSELLSEVPPR